MKTFAVYLSATADVKACQLVKAKSLEEAEEKAIQAAKEGNASWQYEGANDSTIEVTATEEGNFEGYADPIP